LKLAAKVPAWGWMKEEVEGKQEEERGQEQEQQAEVVKEEKVGG
jgi:hypothetical protein